MTTRMMLPRPSPLCAPTPTGLTVSVTTEMVPTLSKVFATWATEPEEEEEVVVVVEEEEEEDVVVVVCIALRHSDEMWEAQFPPNWLPSLL